MYYKEVCTCAHQLILPGDPSQVKYCILASSNANQPGGVMGQWDPAVS